MNIQPLSVDQAAAAVALQEYKQHRSIYDKRDWEIERIYRAISKGKTVIDALGAIRRAGMDEKKRPRLAICEAHAQQCTLHGYGSYLTFGITPESGWGPGTGRIRIEWEEYGYGGAVAQLPRIPPQYRPASETLPRYHILWEADWQDLPRDPYLLKRIGKDAWVVLAAWELTDVEMSVLRSHRNE